MEYEQKTVAGRGLTLLKKRQKGFAIHAMNAKSKPMFVKKYSKTIAVIDGRFICADGSETAPLNSKRTVNTSKLTDDLKEAKNFNFFPEDVGVTKQRNPDVHFYIYNFTETEKGLEWQRFPDKLKNCRGPK